MMLHTCQGCGEAWGTGIINASPQDFDIDPQSREVTSCPNCDGELVTEDHDVTTDDVVQDAMEGRR